MQTMTSAIVPRAAAQVALMRFWAASDEGRSEDRWLPTMTTGTGGFWTMKLRAAAVWCMVSVPWPTTTPAKPSRIASPTRSARTRYCSGPMFSENTPNSFSVSRLQMSASSGTEP